MNTSTDKMSSEKKKDNAILQYLVDNPEEEITIPYHKFTRNGKTYEVFGVTIKLKEKQR